jgi:hypothetical protein
MYFKNIPKINYDFDWEATPGFSGGFVPSLEMQDMFKRVSFTEKTKNDKGAFVDYRVSEGEKPEDVAFNFYGDSSLWWVVFLSNNIVDPFGEWPKSYREIVSMFDTFLSGDSYFIFENLDIRDGDVIIRRDVGSDGSIDGDNFGEIDSYDKLLHKINVKKSKGTINENDEVYIFRNSKIAGEDSWNPIGGFGDTGCYQQYFGATMCVEFTGPNYEGWGPPCATAGSTFAIVQRKETIADGAHHFKYLKDVSNPYSAYPATEHEGPSGDFYSYQSVCGMTGTILYKYITRTLSSDINIITTKEDIIINNDKRRIISLVAPTLIPALIDEFKLIIQGNVPRGTTRIIE